jgi:hypothetical protein
VEQGSLLELALVDGGGVLASQREYLDGDGGHGIEALLAGDVRIDLESIPG